MSPKIESKIHALVPNSIELIIEQANVWEAKGYPDNFVERGIEPAIRAAETELRTTFTPEFSAVIAAEIGQAVESQWNAQPGKK